MRAHLMAGAALRRQGQGLARATDVVGARAAAEAAAARGLARVFREVGAAAGDRVSRRMVRAVHAHHRRYLPVPLARWALAALAARGSGYGDRLLAVVDGRAPRGPPVGEEHAKVRRVRR